MHYFSDRHNISIYEYVEADEDQSKVKQCRRAGTGLNKNMLTIITGHVLY